MPSSRLLVATRAGRRPAFSSSSISRRCSLAMLPWWARTSSSPASSLRRWASRSARRRLLVKTIVLRWLADQLEDPRVDRGPDAGPQLAADDRAAGLLVHRQDLAQARHVLDRHDDLELERLARAGVDDRDLATLADPAEIPGDGLERSLGGAEADALDRTRSSPSSVVARRSAQALEALEAQREVGAALGPGDRVDLVDDHVLDAPEDLARLAGQQEVEALGGRDEDVRRVADEVAPLVRRGVAGPRGDRDARRRVAQAGGLVGDAREGGAEVALDVVGQRLERADVEDPDGAGLLPRRGRARAAGPAGRGTTGTRPASCRCPSGRGSACAGPGRSRPSPRPGPAWAPRTSPRTRPAPRARRERGDRPTDRPWSRPRDAEYRRPPHFVQTFDSVAEPVSPARGAVSRYEESPISGSERFWPKQPSPVPTKCFHR